MEFMLILDFQIVSIGYEWYNFIVVEFHCCKSSISNLLCLWFQSFFSFICILCFSLYYSFSEVSHASGTYDHFIFLQDLRDMYSICIFFLFYSLPYKIICLMHNQIYKAYFVCLLVSLSFYKTIIVWIMEQFNYWIMFEVNSIHVCGQDHFFNYKCHTTPCTDNICMFLYYALYVGFTG